MCCSWDGLVVCVSSLPVFALLPASHIACAALSMGFPTTSVRVHTSFSEINSDTDEF